MISAQLTPTQQQAVERRRAFRASIDAHAAARKVAQSAPATAVGLPPQAVAAETDPPAIIWPVIPEVPEIPSTVFSHIVQIQKVVATHYKIRMTDICSARRTANIVRPRQVAMYLCRTLTNKSYPEIGRRFGGRDHTTALHAFNKINNLLQRMPELEAEVAMFRASLAGLSGVEQ